jgi:hypothetical protein
MFEKTAILGVMGCSTAVGMYYLVKGSNLSTLNKGNGINRINHREKRSLVKR